MKPEPTVIEQLPSKYYNQCKQRNNDRNIGELVRKMFASGNDVEVTRVVIDRDQIKEFLEN